MRIICTSDIKGLPPWTERLRKFPPWWKEVCTVPKIWLQGWRTCSVHYSDTGRKISIKINRNLHYVCRELINISKISSFHLLWTLTSNLTKYSSLSHQAAEINLSISFISYIPDRGPFILFPSPTKSVWSLTEGPGFLEGDPENLYCAQCLTAQLFILLLCPANKTSLLLFYMAPRCYPEAPPAGYRVTPEDSVQLITEGASFYHKVRQ